MGKGKENIDVKSLVVLDRYLTILLESYPKPLRASELAEKAGTTKPAISKIRDRLLRVCDPKAMLFEKGFVLSSDNNSLQSLFLVFAGTGRHRKFLSSKLVQRFVSRKALHPKIIKKFPLYEKHFTPDDTEFMLTKILEATSKIEPKDLEIILKTYYFNRPSSLDPKAIPDLSSVVDKIQFNFKNKRELQKMFLIRDKFYLFIRDSLWKRIEKMEILESISASERPFYVKVYKHTTDFYLRRVFKQVTEPLIKAATDLELDLRTLPVEVGATAIIIGEKQ